MKPLTNRLALFFAAALAGGASFAAQAESGPNPYQAIIDRNPFGLKPPPPPVVAETVAPVIPPGKVVLTGITSLFGRTPRALLEITEQEPGKPATPRHPILKEGERDGAIEVVSIDIEKSLVKIRNAGLETNITFETQKAGGGAAPLIPGFPPPQPMAAGMPGNPGIYSPAAAAAANNAGRNPVGGAYGNTAGAAAANPRAVVPSAYGATATPGAATGFNGNPGLRTIPSRNVRSYPPPPVPGAPAQ